MSEHDQGALGATPTPTERPLIEVGGGPETIRELITQINKGVLPQTYVVDGRPVLLETVSGTIGEATGDAPLPVVADPLSAARLAAALAEHTFTYRRKSRKDGGGRPESYCEEVTPAAHLLAAVLSPKRWPDVPPLRGIVGAPVLRRDGSLLQQRGYDEATGLYLAGRVRLDPVPDRPTPDQVAEARRFVVDHFLYDFPWVSDADRANYFGMLVTPILRPYLRTLTPLLVVTSTSPASGKSILVFALGMLYGLRSLTWTDDEAELRKAITSVFADPAGTVVFDNLPEGTAISSAVLARLMTDTTWADRLLGSNHTINYANDKVWSVTGNNLHLGGDMPSRSAMVRLDPNMPHPEERTGFRLPDLDRWILRPDSQAVLLRHLLILVVDWVRNGAPRAHGVTMRQFTTWAAAVGGFLDHHGVSGFLGNIAEVREADADDEEWTAFLSQWRRMHGDTHVTMAELIRSAQVDYAAGEELDRWEGLFLTDSRGKVPSTRSLGRILRGQIGRYHGDYVLRSVHDLHTKIRVWWVEKYSDERV